MRSESQKATQPDEIKHIKQHSLDLSTRDDQLGSSCCDKPTFICANDSDAQNVAFEGRGCADTIPFIMSATCGR